MGILVAKSRLVRNITLPVLDVMQTMPSFVYLIPALMLFGLGKVPAILATIITPTMAQKTILRVLAQASATKMMMIAHQGRPRSTLSTTSTTCRMALEMALKVLP